MNTKAKGYLLGAVAAATYGMNPRHHADFLQARRLSDRFCNRGQQACLLAKGGLPFMAKYGTRKLIIKDELLSTERMLLLEKK